MTYITNWIMIFFVSLLGSMVPGISFALVLRNTLHSSRLTGIWTAAGLALGMSIYVCIVLLGFAIFILQNPTLSNIIRWGGAAYLAYVGVHCLFSKPKSLNALPDSKVNLVSERRKALLTGLLTNLFNPKVMLFFIALFSQFIYPHMPTTLAWIYGLTVVLVEFCWFSFVAILLTHPVLYQHFKYLSPWIEKLSGIILLGISAHLVVNAI